jgi:hypothetical protein
MLDMIKEKSPYLIPELNLIMFNPRWRLESVWIGKKDVLKKFQGEHSTQQTLSVKLKWQISLKPEGK